MCSWELSVPSAGSGTCSHQQGTQECAPGVFGLLSWRCFTWEAKEHPRECHAPAHQGAQERAPGSTRQKPFVGKIVPAPDTPHAAGGV